MYLPGTALLWIAFLFGLGSTVAYALSLRGDAWRKPARQAYVLMTLATIVASGLLMYLLLTHDYRLFYVTAYSDNSLPLNYLISTFWAGQEGSFLLWVLCSSILGLFLIRFSRYYESRVMIFYNLTVLSLIMLLVRQDPFRFHEGLTAGMIPMDGQGLNPLLQNPWMVIHPPVMFLGYAATAIPFAFALAALWMRKYDEWTKATLPWVLLSLITLGAAIMLGGYWAYETLGWGGYWGWDPVENASLVPWLFTAALAHGMLLQRGRKRFRKTNLILAISGYMFVVYATFLTRSGVLADFSVHSFVDLGITGWLVFNMAFFTLVSLFLLALRWREIPGEEGDEPFLSRTVFFVIGIILLAALGIMVTLGTSSPLITRLWMEKPAQVGPDFYNRVGLPLAIVLGFFIGVIPFLAWKGTIASARKRLVGILAAVAVLVAVAVALGVRRPVDVVYVAAAVFAMLSNGWEVLVRIRRGQWRGAGAYVTHLGLGIMLLAFLTAGLYGKSEKIRLTRDEPTEVLGYTLTFKGVEKPTPDARDAMVVEVSTPRGRQFVLRPKMWVNRKSNQLVANPDIKNFLTTDLYVAPVEFNPAEEAPVSGSVTLTRGQSQAFKDWTLTFEGFDLSRQDAVPGAITVGVLVKLERPGEPPVELEPSIVSTDQGVQAVAVDIPGTSGGKIRVGGMNASAGIVRLELLGLGGGIARHVRVHTGEFLAYRGVKITFDGFDMSGFDPEAGKIDFDIPFTVEAGGETTKIVQHVRGGTVSGPVTIPGSGGMTLEVGRIDAEGGSVEVLLFDPDMAPAPPKPESLVLDVSTKPLISLVWLGTLLALLGMFMALFLRRRDVASIPVGGDE